MACGDLSWAAPMVLDDDTTSDFWNLEFPHNASDIPWRRSVIAWMQFITDFFDDRGGLAQHK